MEAMFLAVYNEFAQFEIFLPALMKLTSLSSAAWAKMCCNMTLWEGSVVAHELHELDDALMLLMLLMLMWAWLVLVS